MAKNRQSMDTQCVIERVRASHFFAADDFVRDSAIQSGAPGEGNGRGAADCYLSAMGLYETQCEASYSEAQPSTKAVLTASHLPVPCTYSSSAWPTLFFHSSDGIMVKFQETWVLPDF